MGLERQLSRSATVSATYLNSHGVHQLFTRDINAPYCSPSDSSCTPLNGGVRPYRNFANISNVGNIYQYESAGLFNQNQLITNFNMRMGAKLMLVGFYTLSYAHSNTGGVSSFVMNPYDIEEDYGRAAFDVRHRVFVGGTWTLPRGFAVSPFIVANTGAPVNVTLGQDVYGTGIFNARPALVPAGALNSQASRWGTFSTVPTSGQPIPPNYGTGPRPICDESAPQQDIRLGKKDRAFQLRWRNGEGWRQGWLRSRPRRTRAERRRRVGRFVRPDKHQHTLQSHLYRKRAQYLQQREPGDADWGSRVTALRSLEWTRRRVLLHASGEPPH